MTKKVIRIITVVLLAAACFKDPEFKPAEININRTTLDLGKEASQNDISLLSNRDWKAEIVSTEGTPDWLRLSNTAGVASKDSVHITVSVLSNSGEDRFATVNFRTGTVYASLRVFQKGEIEHYYTPIKDVRALYKGSDVAISEDMTIKGTVISNYRSNNFGGLNNATSSKTLVISDEDAGISFFLTENNTALAPGDVVTVKLKGLTLQRYNGGSLQVNGIPLENITLLSNGQVPEPVTITAAQLITGKYESRYVAVADVQVADSDLGKKFVPDKEKHSSIKFVSKTNESFVLFSSKYSTYGDKTVPEGSGTLKGIAMVFGNSTYQISITSMEDLAGLTNPRFSSSTPPSSGGKTIGDYSKWNAIAPVTSFYDDFSSITEKDKEYLNDNWLFYSTDGTSVNTGWKTGVFNEDRYIQIAPYSSSSDQVVAFALMPKADVAGANPKTYNFRKALYYREADDSKCEVVVSKDFAGNFEAATWTVVKDVTFPADAKLNEWIQEDVDLSGYASETSLCIALRYTGKGNTYRIDDVKFGDAEAACQFTIGIASKTVSADAGSFDITVGGNVEWTVSSSNPADFSVSPASGNGSGKVTVTYTENTGNTARKAEITFTTAAEVAKKQLVCTVTQKAKGESAGGELTSNVDITSNIAQGEKAYNYIIHSNKGDIEGLKIGTSSKAGNYTTPALPETGDLQFSMYAVAWNKAKCALTVTINGGGTIDGAASKTFDLRSEPKTANTTDAGTFDYTDDDYFTATLSGITSSSTITFSTTVNGGMRAVIAGVNVKK